MAQKTLVQLGSGGTVQSDPAATPDTIVERDSSGNIAGAQVAGSEVKTSGRLTLKSTTVTGTTTIVVATAATWFCDATGGAFTITLPAASGGNLDAVISISKVDVSANAITVAGGVIANSLATQGASSRWQSTGSVWAKVG